MAKHDRPLAFRLRLMLAALLLSGLVAGRLVSDELRERLLPRRPPVAAGRARAAGIVDRDRNSPRITVPVQVDVAGVRLDGQPPVLGAYVARVVFDPLAVVYVQTAGGAEPRFGAPPAATAPAIANQQGFVRLVAVQTDDTGPIGVVSVARVTFWEIRPGGSQTISVHLESVATALRRDAAGTPTAPVALEIERDAPRTEQP